MCHRYSFIVIKRVVCLILTAVIAFCSFNKLVARELTHSTTGNGKAILCRKRGVSNRGGAISYRSSEPGVCNQELSIYKNPFKYSGYYQDPESLNYYLNARYYSSNLMRFISRDTYDLSNRYAYGNGNPTGNIDPNGHNALSCLFGGVGIISTTLVAAFTVFAAPCCPSLWTYAGRGMLGLAAISIAVTVKGMSENGIIDSSWNDWGWKSEDTLQNILNITAVGSDSFSVASCMADRVDLLLSKTLLVNRRFHEFQGENERILDAVIKNDEKCLKQLHESYGTGNFTDDLGKGVSYDAFVSKIKPYFDKSGGLIDFSQFASDFGDPALNRGIMPFKIAGTKNLTDLQAILYSEARARSETKFSEDYSNILNNTTGKEQEKIMTLYTELMKNK